MSQMGFAQDVDLNIKQEKHQKMKEYKLTYKLAYKHNKKPFINECSDIAYMMATDARDAIARLNNEFKMLDVTVLKAVECTDTDVA